VDEDLHPFPLLEQDGLASPSTQDQPHSHQYSPGTSQDQISIRDNDGAKQSASEELAPHSLLATLYEDGGGKKDANVSKLGINLLLAFEEQEMSSLATATGSPRPHHHPAELSQLQIYPEHDQSGTGYGRFEELGHDSLLHYQDHDEDRLQEQEVAVEVMKEDDDYYKGEHKHGFKQGYNKEARFKNLNTLKIRYK
jgi:hypothetical protein